MRDRTENRWRDHPRLLTLTTGAGLSAVLAGLVGVVSVAGVAGVAAAAQARPAPDRLLTDEALQRPLRATAQRPAAPTVDRQAYVNLAGPAAQAVQAEYDIPASVVAGMSANESAWGASKAATQDNNYFGVKCVGGKPGPIAVGCINRRTTECTPTCHPTTAQFRVYNSMRDSFRDLGRLLTTSPNYAHGLPHRKDADAFVRAIQRPYATDPEYANKVIRIMRDYDLYRFNKPTAGPAVIPLQASRVLLTPNQQHYFGRGAGGELAHLWWDATKPGPGLGKDLWGGRDAIAGQPVTLNYGDQQHAFALDPAGRLRHWWWYPGIENNLPKNDTWHDGSPKLVGDVTGFVSGNQQHAFARDTEGNLRHWWWYPGIENNQPKNDVWHSGGGLNGDPTAIVFGQEQHVFATDSAGKLRHWWWDPNKKEGGGMSADTWGSGVQGKPALFLYGAQQHVFVRGTDGNVQHFWWDPVNAGDPAGGKSHDTWSSGGGLTSDPLALVYGNQQHAFARDARGNLQHWWWYPDETPGGSWNQDSWHDGGGLAGSPAGFVTGQQQHVLAPDSGGRLRHWWWDANKSENGGMSADVWGEGLAAG